MSARLLSIYQSIVLRHPLAVLIAVLLLAVGMAFGLPNFKLDASADSLTLEHDTDLDYYRKTLQHYGSSDFLVVTYTPKEGDLFDDASLATLAEIRDELKQIEGVANVTSRYPNSRMSLARSWTKTPTEIWPARNFSKVPSIAT